MESFIKEIDSGTVAVFTTLVGVIIFFIKDGSQVIFGLLKEILNHWWELKKQELIIKNEVKNKILQVKAEKEMLILNSSPLVKDVIRLTSVLKEIREALNAFRVTVYMYHNGTAQFFKNFSARHQDCRYVKDGNLEHYQNRPLSPFYPVILKAAQQEITVFIEESEFEIIVHKMQLSGIKKYVTFMITLSEDTDKSNSVLRIETKYGKKTPIGHIGIELDEESEELTDSMMNYLKGIRETTETLYLQSPEIFG